MARLPEPGQDQGVWGQVLNTYLSVSHDATGAIKSGSVAEAQLSSSVQTKLNQSPTVADGTITQAKLDSALQSTISGKANTASLAAVAISGSYNDLSNKPSIPTTTDGLPEGTTNKYFSSGAASAAAPVQSVSGKTGAVNLTPADVQLGNVDNTSDLAKPVSNATQTALNAKVNTASLATIATSGSYLDATNKPLIVLGPADPVPGGTAAGTVIIRTTT